MGAMYLKAMLITLILLAFAVPGFVLKKLNMIGDGGKLAIGNILLYVCQPAMIIAAFCVFSDEDYAALLAADRVELAIGFCITAAISLAALLAVYGLCRLVFFRCKNRDAADVYSYIAVFSNCGFLGVPFIQMFTDGNAVAVMYLMVFNVVFVVLIWTLGVYLITHDKSAISPKKVLLNPTIIASALGLLLFFVPQINIFMTDGVKELSTIPSALSTMTAPLAMMLVGVATAEIQPKILFATPGVYIASALRLVVAPVVTFAIAALFLLPFRSVVSGFAVDTDYIFLAPVVAMAMSPASLIVAMTEHYDREKTTAAASYVTATLLSVITVPLAMLAALAVWGVMV